MKQPLLTLLALVLIVNAATATNGTRSIGFGAQTIGRGGTSIGVFDSPTLMVTNPAGLVFLKHEMIDLTFGLMVPGLSYRNDINAADGETHAYPLPGLSYVAKIGNDLAWGVGAFTQGGMGADFTLNHPLFRDANGNYVRQDYFSKLGVMQGGASIAWLVAPEFSVGASAHLVYSTKEFRMPFSLLPSIMKGIANPSTGMTFGDMFAAPAAQGGFAYTEVTAAAAMTDLTAFGFTGKIGVAWVPNPNVSLGLSYGTPTTLTYKNGKASMDMTAQMNDAFAKAMAGVLAQNPGMTTEQAQAAVMQMFGNLGIDLSLGVAATYDLETKLKLPQTIGLGMMMTITDGVRLSADFEYVGWEQAFDAMTLTMTNGDNANINRMLGTDGSLTLEFPLKWEDAMTLRAGVEWDVNPDLTVRAGGAFGTNPVAASTLFPVFPAIVEDHIMAGCSYRVIAPLMIHAAYEHAFNATRTAAASSLLAREYDGSVSQLSEDIFNIGASWIIE